MSVQDCPILRVVHDGMGNGVGKMETMLLKEQFGPDRYIHRATPAELPVKVGAILRSVRGV